MKKVILSVAVIAASALSFVSMAQNPSQSAESNELVSTSEVVEQPTQKSGRNMVKGGHPNKMKAAKARMQAQRNKQHGDIFAGLDLTDAQKEQLKSICPERQKCQSETAEGEKSACDNSTPCKGKHHGDSPQAKGERCEKKTEFLQKVKEILTPEQYTKFLENNFRPKH